MFVFVFILMLRLLLIYKSMRLVLWYMCVAQLTGKHSGGLLASRSSRLDWATEPPPPGINKLQIHLAVYNWKKKMSEAAENTSISACTLEWRVASGRSEASLLVPQADTAHFLHPHVMRCAISWDRD